METISKEFNYHSKTPLSISLNNPAQFGVKKIIEYKITINVIEELYDYYLWTNVGGMGCPFCCCISPFLKFKNYRLGELICYYQPSNNIDDNLVVWSGMQYIQKDYIIEIPSGVNELKFYWNDIFFNNNSGKIIITLEKIETKQL